MKAFELEAVLNNHIPRSATWGPSSGEPYGLQNRNRFKNHEVSRVLFCVTFDDYVCEYAIRGGYDAIISHHPTFLHSLDIPLFIYHTALDFCEGGLCDFWADILMIENRKPIAHGSGGWYGDVYHQSFKNLVGTVHSAAGNILGQCESNLNIIRKVAVVSGLGGFVESYVDQLSVDEGVDCFITGQLLSSFNELAVDAVIEMGHTNSERVGYYILRDILLPVGIHICLAPIGIDSFGSEVFVKNMLTF